MVSTPKLPEALQAIVVHVRPVTATTAPGLHPDLGRGTATERDEALDADAAGGAGDPFPEPGPSESAEQAGADVDASLATARGEEAPLPIPLHDPLEDYARR
jgi:hypothetical protein